MGGGNEQDVLWWELGSRECGGGESKRGAPSGVKVPCTPRAEVNSGGVPWLPASLQDEGRRRLREEEEEIWACEREQSKAQPS